MKPRQPDPARASVQRERELIDAARREIDPAAPGIQPTQTHAAYPPAADHPDGPPGYEIIRELGRGGMGVVYLARDTQLKRAVAIKTIPPLFASDRELLARLQHEAQLLATLSHPNIASVYTLTERDHVKFLVMEYIEGQTLAQRLLRGGAPPIDEALPIAVQIAAGLEAAHEAGVIHRDVKPGNVMFTPDGKVKVLDFGLARAAHRGSETAELSADAFVTQEHTVLGTSGYMSPEQARAKPVDKRTDIWAFGCVLYELLTGRRAFGGQTHTDVIAVILEREPDWGCLPARTPWRVRELLKHCLKKEARDRLRDIGDARIELEAALAGREWSTASIAPARRGARARLRTAAAPASPAVTRMSVCVPQPLAMWLINDDARPLLTPDGRTLVYAARDGPSQSAIRRVYRRRLDEANPVAIAGTENALAAMLSPDGRFVAFVSQAEGTAEKPCLSAVPLDGSAPPTKVCSFGPTPALRFSFGAWLPDGDFLFIEWGQPARIYRVTGDGGSPMKTIEVHPRDLGYDTIIPGPLLPDGHTLLVTACRFSNPWTQDVALVDLPTGRLSILLTGAFPAYARTGHLVFGRQDTLLAVPFDAERLKVTGPPVAVVAGVRTFNDQGVTAFAISLSGTLAYVAGPYVGQHRRLAIMSARGVLAPWSDDARPLAPELNASLDGIRFVTVVENQETLWEVWGSELERARFRPLARRSRHDVVSPKLSPDGQRLAVRVTLSASEREIAVYPFDGSGEPVALVTTHEAGTNMIPCTWTPDGAEFLYSLGVPGHTDLMAVPVGRASLPVDSGPDGRPREPRKLIPGMASTRNACFSNDGMLLAYESDESGRWEVVVRTYATAALGPPVSVSPRGGTCPVWSPDSRRLYFTPLGPAFRANGLWCEAGEVLCVDVSTEPTLGATTPVPAPDMPDAPTREKLGIIAWTPLPSGRFLVMLKGEDEAPSDRFEVVLNWFEELKSKVPTPSK